MKKARFNLNKIKGEDIPTLLLLVYSCHDKRLRYSTQIKTTPKKWDKDRMRLKGRKSEDKKINSQLDFIEKTFDSIILEYQRQSVNPSRDRLKSDLDMRLGRTLPVEEKEKLELMEFFEFFIEERTNQGNQYSKGTLKKYKVLLNGLKKYIAARKLKTLTYENINHKFYNDFVAFLFSSEEINSKNTVNYYVTRIKMIMKEAQKRGYHNFNDYREFKGMSEKSEAIYLSNVDIQKLWDLNLSFSNRLERVRDLFLLGCETGLRFSDFTQIGEENIQTVNGVDLIRIVQQKTNDDVTIPLKPIAKAILKKYDNKLPKAISNQKMNQYLKEIGELAQLDEMVTLKRGGTQITDKKYNLISTHTARRSFATNAYLARVPSIAIMKITGHRSEKSFMKYIKVDSLQSALNIADHPFFTGKSNDKKSPLRKVS